LQINQSLDANIVNPKLESNNYLYVPQLISADRAVEMSNHFRGFAQNNILEQDHQAPNSPAIYNYQPFLELLCELTPKVSEQLEEPALPTYTYARVYKGAEELKRHRDRPACEVSLTLHLQGDVDWPIWIQKPDGEEVSLTLAPGDAMMYLGCVADHWRETYTGEWYSQVFLHYVRSRGPCAWAYFDKVK
jgi:hypothetical protein